MGGAQHALRMRERSIMIIDRAQSLLRFLAQNENDCLSGYRGGIMLWLPSRIFVPDESLQPRPTGAAQCPQPLPRPRQSHGFGHANNGKSISS